MCNTEANITMLNTDEV